MSTADSMPPAASMITRFSGERGRTLVLELLADMPLLRSLTDLSGFLDRCDLIEVGPGEQIIEQGGSGNSIFLIISGRFDILVNGRHVATRFAGSHFGEMALVDATSRRSATVVASEHSLLLSCSEPTFTAVADQHPRVWRRLAVELSRRLAERNRLIRPPRSQPIIFIGCSTESLTIARSIQDGLSFDPVIVELWTDGIFNASHTPIEDLTELVGTIDFGVLVLAPDDTVTSRGEVAFGPRDNVVFELGLIIGAIGRQRTFIVVPRGIDLKLPSDLLGVRTIDYADGDASTLKSRTGPVCNELRSIFARIGSA